MEKHCSKLQQDLPGGCELAEKTVPSEEREPQASVPFEAGSLGVTAQPATELLQGSDSAGLGTGAPVLELPHELLLGGARALPQRRKLLPHPADGIEHFALAQGLAHFFLFAAGQRVPARMKQA